METIERDYGPKGVNFYYVYKALAHPEWDGYVKPFTLEERLAHIEEAKRVLGTRFTWLCDTMDNEFKHAMGSRPNSEFVVDPDGVIVRSRDWSNPEQLREDLEELVGPVEDPTTVEELEFAYEAPPMAAAKGVVPRVEKPEQRMAPLAVVPDWSKNEEPWYAKLRAEAGKSLLEEGSGNLYLGFRLDPLYGVHWNNLDADSIRVKIETPEGVTVSDSTLQAPKVEAPADIDPREFLVTVDGAEEGDELVVHASYFACSDAEGWCKPIEQRYRVRLERNRDGGWVFPDRMNKMFNQRLGREAPEPTVKPESETETETE